MTWMSSRSARNRSTTATARSALFPFGFGLTYGATAEPRARTRRSQAESFNAQSGTQNETTHRHRWRAGRRATSRRVTGSPTTSTSDPPRRPRSPPGSPPAPPPAAPSSTGWTAPPGRSSPASPVSTDRRLADLGRASRPTLTGAATGVHRVYLTFTGTAGGDFVNVNWLQFAPGSGSPNAYQQRQAESFTLAVRHPDRVHHGHRWRAERRLHHAGRLAGLRQCGLRRRPRPASVTTRIASGATVTGTIQYRLDSTTGPIIASVPVSPPAAGSPGPAPPPPCPGSATGVHTALPHLHRHGRRDFTNLNWFQFNH